jgi:glycosyltransferase involved in cell wall biosynthesis
LLVPAGDAGALAQVLRRLIDDRELRERLSRGALESVRDFAVEHHVAEISRIYERVALRYNIPRTAALAAEEAVGNNA